MYKTDMVEKPKKILVSACLAGQKCRYDCHSCDDQEVIRLVQEGRAIAVCPEELGGLSTPRPPAEKVGNKIRTNEGHDVTLAFEEGAKRAWQLVSEYEIEEAILKSKSPSCGVGEIYDGSFSGKLVPGDGVFAAMLKKLGVKIKAK